MRRTAAFILAAAVMITMLTSCGRVRSDENEGDERLRVVATIFPQYDFVRAVAGDRVSLTMLVSPGSESHTYEPSIRDIVDVIGADLFIYTGGDIDPWAEALAETAEDSGVMSISVMDAIETSEHEHTHDDGDEHGEEHVWTSPANAILILDYITDALCALDPDGAEIYRANADEYGARIAALGDELSEISRKAAGKTVVVADRFPFDSLFSDYGIEHAEALGGCAVGEEPSAAVVGELIGLVTEQNITHVFYIEFSERKIADLISEATGCGTLLLHSCHNVDADDFERGVTYLQLMERNVQNLREVLS